jgi:hypothetical protein
MRFWIYDATRKTSLGPYNIAQLKAIPSFNAETVVAIGKDNVTVEIPVPE